MRVPPLLMRAARLGARLAAVAAMAATLLGATDPAVTVTGPQPEIPGRITAAGTVNYATAANGQDCSLRYWPAEASALLSTTLAPATLDQFGACLGPLLDALLRDHPALPTLTLTLGDLTPLTALLNTALGTAPNWNPATGQPRTGTLSALLTGLLNDRHLARPLDDAFQKRGYTLRATAARMVTVAPVPSAGGRRLVTGISLLEFNARRTTGGQ